MKNKTSLYGNKKARRSSIVAISILLVVAIVLNVALSIVNEKYGLFISRFLSGDNVDTSVGGEVFADADKVVRTAAEESMVLLENKDDFLPLKDLAKVNLFGWGSTEYGFLLTGGGSGGAVIANDKDVKVDLNDAFTEANIEYNQDLYNAYVNFSNFDADYRTGGTTGAHADESLRNPDASFYTEELMSSAKAYSPVAVAVLSRWGAENGGDNELKSIGGYRDGAFLQLTAEEKAMFDALEAHGFDVIVVLNVCNNMELGFVKDYNCIKACIFAGIPGQSGASAIPKIITGEVNPSGKTSDTLAYDYNLYNPTYANATKASGNLVYQEGIYFGYKWYETADAVGFFKDVNNSYGSGYDGVVQYPFGYGLSYTSFSWKVEFPTISGIKADDGNYEVKVAVENIGAVAGKDVVQLYGHVDYTEGGIEKAEKVLVDFAKTKLLAPGEKETVTLNFSAYDLASYDDYDKNHNNFCGYELEGGSNNVEMSVQTDSHTVLDSKKYSVTGNIKFEKDPHTGAIVENRFTGKNAYANCPIDGSTAYTSDKINYLSRSGNFENYSAIKQYAAPSNDSAVRNAVNYTYDGYNDKDVSAYQYGQDVGIYLVRAAESAEATETYKANLAQLNGGASDVVLKVNEDMKDFFAELMSDYDSEYWDLFLDQLTQQEIAKLIGSGGFMTVALESIGKTRCTDKDGPAGFNNNVTNPNASSVYTLYPSESLLGCSWSRDVGYSIGEAQGKIGSELGVQGWYGPGVNLHRSVYNSRNYEYYSEDGVLSGILAAATIKGAKDNNLYCYVKHIAVSEAGQNPKLLNTWLTEQALRETYLKPFEITVKEGETVGMMSAFNRVGAVLAGYNHALLTDVLRDEWGFHGTVITDWYMSDSYMNDYTKGVLAGNDLWLSGSGELSANLDFSNPAVAYAARQSAKSIIYTYMTTLLSSSDLKVNAEKQSPIYTMLWIFLDLIVAAFIVLNVVKLVRTFIAPKTKAKEASGNADATQDETTSSVSEE